MVHKTIKRFFAFLALASSAGMLATVSTSKNLFLPRAYSANSAREVAMLHQCCRNEKEGFSASISVAGSYQRMWDQNATKGLGALPFWSGTNRMSVGTSSVLPAAPTIDLDPWHLGLGRSTGVGAIQLNPVLYQVGADFMLAVQASANEPGFFGRIKAPVAVMSIDPKLSEPAKVVNGTYYNNTIGLQGFPQNPVYKNLTESFVGDKTYGSVAKMAYGRINGKQSVTRFGDIELALGYNFINDEDKCLGVAVHASGPTGNKPTGQYMLEPVVGRGGNWGLGAQIIGHACIWEGQVNNRKLHLNLNANIMHLFKAKSVRSYDLKSSPGSKYMLVATFSDTFVFQNKVNNLINHSTLESKSKFGAEADITVALNYQTGNWRADLGYNLWGRSSETLEITGALTPNLATISRGALDLAAGGVGESHTNPRVSINQQTDIRPRPTAATVLKLEDLDVAAAQQAGGCTSKLFGHLTYNWMDVSCCPHLGVMGEFELSHSDNNALPQWGVGVEGGVSF